jgi:hypothetical protein
MTTYEQRLADIEEHVQDGLITRDEADRKIADLKAMKAFGDLAKNTQIVQ